MRYDTTTGTFGATATDLAHHARCEHLTHRSRARAIAVADGREERAVATGLAVVKGREFEAAYVARRRAAVEARGGTFLDVRAAAGPDPRRQRELAERAMRDGICLIAQAPLRAGSVAGVADLLVRVDDAAHPAGTLQTRHRYEPVEIKFARTVRPEHVLQACAYADALEPLQGDLPEHLHVVTGDGIEHPHRTAHYVEYFRASRARFEAALDLPLEPELARVTDPVPHCAACDFADACLGRRREVDHLSLVAFLRGDQRPKLVAAGVSTVAQLAAVPPDRRIAGIGLRTLPYLATQARLQVEARSSGPVGVEYRVPAADELPGRGFALLPEPDPADVFFDFEGYPYHESGALEYLWGWSSYDASGELRFDELWADDPATEARAFSAFLDEVHHRWECSPGMHVYHYAPYEVTALRRLAKQHHHEAERLDQLLRAGVFVDLYAVVRQAMQVGTESYSIKQLEPLYGVDRSGDELADGGASIEVYEQWLLTRDPSIRDTIVAYNKVDCDSTVALRDWLLGHRDAAAARGIRWPELARGEADPDAADAAAATLDDDAGSSLVDRLESVADDASRADDVRTAARLLSAMPGWQRRVDREFFGDLHARKHERDVDELIREPAALAGLTLVGDPEDRGRGTTCRRYRYPEQVTLVDVGNTALDAFTVCTVGTVEHVDVDECIVTIKTTRSQQRRIDELQRANGIAAGTLPESIVGWTDIPTRQLEAAAASVGASLLASLDAGRDPFAGGAPAAAALSILAGHPPRVTSGAGPESLALPPDPADLADLVQRLEGSHVTVQGPPGTGKTWTSARLVVALVEAGLRVGISSNSHAAVINVLDGLREYREERHAGGIAVRERVAYGLRSGETAPGDLAFGAGWIERPKGSAGSAALLRSGDVQILAGTAWQFARDDLDVDVVLVDEAGQVSLLHATAMASRARTVVLVGDPQQLPQPSSATHPSGCGASVLEHLFGGRPVLPSSEGVLLPVTRRLHPAIAEFIGTSYYEGTLTAHESTSAHRVSVPARPELSGAGTRVVSVEHAGCRSSSPEEADAIAAGVADLLAGGTVVAAAGTPERAITPADILVVAPYNAQRRLLQQRLPDGVAIGTVDKFQGQEAPIAIMSMTASGRDELPRGLEFLLDPHRLNVGVSRAKALAILVASPSLLATSAGTLDEMRMLNDLARFARRSSTQG